MRGRRERREWPTGPLTLSVTLKTDDEVYVLRAKVHELETALEGAREEQTRLEFLYGNECYVNAELVDLLRTTNVKFRPTMEGRARGRGGSPGPVPPP